MNPEDPQESTVPSAPPSGLEIRPPAPEPPAWDYSDLAFLITLCVPALFLAAMGVKLVAKFVPLGQAFQGLLAQLLWYGLVFGCLYMLLRIRYGEPFWRSLGWKVPFRGAMPSFLGGPLLALAIGYLGYVLRTPEIQLPFQQMLADRPTTILFALFVVILGPLCEELAFRGFLMPLLIRSFGAAAGIVGTGLLFGGLHAFEYSWSWRHVLLISAAGTVFGWLRYKTGSTAASTYMHSTYNLTQLAAFLAQVRTQ